MDHNNIGLAIQAHDRRDIADEIIVELIIERRVDRVSHIDHEKRVSVSGRTHDGLRADIVASARPVINDKWLAEPLREPLTEQAGKNVERAAASGGENDSHRWRRIGLRPCYARKRWERGCARGRTPK